MMSWPATEPRFRSSITSISECNRLPTVASWVSSRELGNFARSYSSGSPYLGRLWLLAAQWQCLLQTLFTMHFQLKRKKSVMHLVFYHHFRDKPVLFFSSLLYENKMACSIYQKYVGGQYFYFVFSDIDTIIDSVI